MKFLMVLFCSALFLNAMSPVCTDTWEYHVLISDISAQFYTLDSAIAEVFCLMSESSVSPHIPYEQEDKFLTTNWFFNISQINNSIRSEVENLRVTSSRIKSIAKINTIKPVPQLEFEIKQRSPVTSPIYYELDRTIVYVYEYFKKQHIETIELLNQVYEQIYYLDTIIDLESMKDPNLENIVYPLITDCRNSLLKIRNITVELIDFFRKRRNNFVSFMFAFRLEADVPLIERPSYKTNPCLKTNIKSIYIDNAAKYLILEAEIILPESSEYTKLDTSKIKILPDMESISMVTTDTVIDNKMSVVIKIDNDLFDYWTEPMVLHIIIPNNGTAIIELRIR